MSFSSIDPNELTFREPTKIEHGIILSTDGTFRDTTFQLPPMSVRFEPNPTANGAIKITTEVTNTELIEWLKRVDAQVIQQLVTNSQEWFKSKKPLTEAVAKDKYSGLHNVKDPKYNPLMKLKLNDKSKRTPTDVFRMREDGKSVEQCDVKDVCCGDTVTAIARLTGLFVGTTGMVFPQISVDEMLVESGNRVLTTTLPYSEVDPARFQYTDPKKLDKGGEVVFMEERISIALHCRSADEILTNAHSAHHERRPRGAVSAGGRGRGHQHAVPGTRRS